MEEWTYFPAILMGPDHEPGYAAYVVGNGVNGQGDTATDALTELALILQEIIDDAMRDGEPLPRPAEPSAEDLAEGTLVMVPAKLPHMAA